MKAETVISGLAVVVGVPMLVLVLGRFFGLLP